MIVHYHPTGFFQESRCSLENWNLRKYDHTLDTNPHTQKIGIRCYNFLAALILRIFNMIRIETTKDGKSVYLNRKSFKKWEKWRNFDKPLAPKKKQPKIIDHVWNQTKPCNHDNPQEVKDPIKPEREIKQQTPELPSLDTEPPADVNETAPLVQNAVTEFVKIMRSNCGKNLADIWENFLACIPTEDIVSFKQKDNNRYVLTFNRPLSLWLDSRDKKGKPYPKGGTIVLIGHNKSNKMEFFTDDSSKKITFENGLQFWCKTPIGKRAVKVFYMQEKNTDIELRAGIMLRSKSELHPKKKLLNEWRSATLLDSKEDYKAFLKKKLLSKI